MGALYAVDDEANRVRAYTIFSMAINVGAVLGPLVCGLLAQLYGWHTGFGAAALFIMIGLVTYLAGYRHLPAHVARTASDSRALTSAEWRRIRAICAVLAIVVFPATSYLQCMNTAAVWVQDHVNPDRRRLRHSGAVVQRRRSRCSRSSACPWCSHSGAGRPRRRAGVESGDLEKIGLGGWLVASANLILVAAILALGDDGLSPIWPFLYFAMMGFSFLFYWPVTLALVSRAAPAPVNATMMGVAFLALFVAATSWAASAGFMACCRRRRSGDCTPLSRRREAWRC